MVVVIRHRKHLPRHRVADYVSKALKKEHLQGTTEDICLIGGQEWKSNILKEIKSIF